MCGLDCSVALSPRLSLNIFPQASSHHLEMPMKYCPLFNYTCLRRGDAHVIWPFRTSFNRAEYFVGYAYKVSCGLLSTCTSSFPRSSSGNIQLRQGS